MMPSPQQGIVPTSSPSADASGGSRKTPSDQVPLQAPACTPGGNDPAYIGAYVGTSAYKPASGKKTAPYSGRGGGTSELLPHPTSPRLNPTDAGMIMSRAVLLRKLSIRCLTSCSFMTPEPWYRFWGAQ